MSSVNTESQDKGDVKSSLQLLDPTMAADSVRNQREPLLSLISHCLSSLANVLLAKSIIPRDVYKKVCNPFLEDSERGGALLDCVETRIRLNASCFATFIDILKSEPFLNDQAEVLIQSYCTLSSTPTIRYPAAISPAILQYAAYLRGVYRNSPISPDSKWPPTPSKKYINLATVESGTKCRDEFIGHTLHGNIKEILKFRKEVSIDNILVPDEEGLDYLKLVLIEGAPGIGKSTLAWELCRRWEQGCIEKYSLTVLLRLREKKVQEIINLPELFFSCQDREILMKEVSSNNGKGVLFILDGFDELPTTLQMEGFLVDLIRGTFLPECTVMVTSRPSATAKFLTICRPQIQKHIEVLGFTQESVEEYATSIFSSEPERLQGFKAFISASNNPAINSLMYVPLNAAIIVEIYCHGKSDHLLPRTLTQVYTQLCLTILSRYLQGNPNTSVGVNRFKDLPDELYQEFLKLAEIAFDGMTRQEVIFHTLPPDLVHFGFLDAFSSLYGGGSVSYNFLHLTLQEFFAAYHISHQLFGDARQTLLRKCGGNERWNVVWRFVAGLTEFKFFEGYLNNDIFASKIDNDMVQVRLLFVQCLFEANISMGRSDLFGHKNIDLFAPNYTLTPLDWYALGNCIANLTIEVSWDILINKFDCMECFTNGLKTSNTYHRNINSLRVVFVKGVPPNLEQFPLRGITHLILNSSTFVSTDLIDLFHLLPSMTSLRELRVSRSTFSDLECFDKFLHQLFQTSIASLDIEDINLTKSISFLEPLVDPQTGTLIELRVDSYVSILASSNKFINDTLLLRVVCAPTSLKSLKLLHPRNIHLLTQLEINTCLTELYIGYKRFVTGGIPRELVEILVKIIVGIVEHNKRLEHLAVGEFKLPRDINALRDIVEALHRNSTLKSVTIVVRHPCDFKDSEHLSNHMREKYQKICEPRISWESYWKW